MKWILYVVGALALLLLIITTIGYLLPGDHVASRTAKFRKPPAEVFVLISGSCTWTWEIKPTAECSEGHVTENGFVSNPI